MLKPNKRNKKTQKSPRATGLNFDLTKIQPITYNQERVFELYESGKNLVLYGSAGVGKSMVGLYLGLRDMMENGTFSKIVIIRSAVASRDIGFLPGTDKEKVEVYEAPYRAIVNDLYCRDDAYDIMKQKSIIQFESTSFLRGLTYENCLLFVDEIQNMNFQELDTILTRLHDSSKIIFAGDIKQCDFNTKKETSGIQDFMQILTHLNEFSMVEFTPDDIVRSGLVKNYIIAKEKLGL